MSHSLYLPVIERSQAGEARRMTVAWADRHGFNVDRQAQLALVVSELAGNLALHTKAGGGLLLRALAEMGSDAVEILSLDQGPGSTNFGACLRDGYSTAGTSGIGLGAVQRASSYFEVHSQPEFGTALLSRVGPSDSPAPSRFQFGLINVPIKGENVCGDACAYSDLGGGKVRILMADGLGHGPLAAEASQAALTVFRADAALELPRLFEKIHAALRTTRGAAMAIAEVDAAQGRVTYMGVGNIAGSLVQPNGDTSHLVSQNGTVGVVLPTLRPFTYAWSPETLLVMTSDGIKNHWRLDRYAGLMNRHPSLIAGILFRDHSRKTDDVTAAVFRFSA